MNHQHTFDREKDFEDALVAALQARGWAGDVLVNPSEQDLTDNWARILYANNRGRDRLGDAPLTATEMQQLVDKINGLRTSCQRNAFINGGATSVMRDNPASEHCGREVTLKIYDRDEIAGGQSVYQIARQVRLATAPMLNDRRGDLTLLINGMPMFHIELKRSGVPVSQAANQIEKYAREGAFRQGLMSLVQIFVAMNPAEAVYYANPGEGRAFNPDFYFHWADWDNEPVNEWWRVADDLLSIPMAHQMIGFYTVADGKDDTLKVLRSYQYYAASAISDKVRRADWADNTPYGGYVWHTTGSGKTMTSFKSAQLIAQGHDADKVVFLMDRIELGTQSLAEYQDFADDDQQVQGTQNTAELYARLREDSRQNTLIVTSIQKMSNIFERGTVLDAEGREAPGGYRRDQLAPLRRKRLVFIVDECHRSTFGPMLATIKRTFPGAMFFGFTGTPIDEANAVRGMTTGDVFGQRLHVYSIADGIRDKNVLCFDPVKISTFDEQDMKLQVALASVHARTVAEVYAHEEKEAKFHEIMALPMTAIEERVPTAQYRTAQHREKVVEDIGRHFLVRSHGRKLHAIFATSSIPEAIAYYRLVKEKMPHLNVTGVFDPTIDNNGGGQVKEEGLVEILTDYNARFGCEFAVPTWAGFKKDVAKRLAHKRPYTALEPGKQLDMVIVVDQMLTGFDSKWVNVLYLDKVLDYDGLIQAFSRTNRLCRKDIKPHGTICYYRRPNTMERNIDQAFELYAHGRPAGVFVSKICRNVEAVNAHYEEIKFLFERAGVEGFAALPVDQESCARFASQWRKLNDRLGAAVMQGFAWSRRRYTCLTRQGKKQTATLAFDHRAYLAMARRYKELFEGPRGPRGGGDVPYEIDTRLTAIDTGLIDYEYLNSRFRKYTRAVAQGAREAEGLLEELHRSFATLSAEQQRYANMILHEAQMGTLEAPEGKTLMDHIVERQTRAHCNRVHAFAQALGLDEGQLRAVMEQHPGQNDINQGGQFDRLARTLDAARAGAYLNAAGAPVPQRQVMARARQLIRKFILEGGFDIVSDYAGS